MAKPVIVTRIGKGSELSFQEGDDNFTNLQNATVTVAGDSGSAQAIDLNDTVTVAGGTGLSSAMTSKTVTLNLDNTAVTPASYTKASITVDAQGRITAASNGSADFTQSDARTAISVTDSGGDGSLAYDNSTGVITYTGPSASEVRAHFSGGTGITITDGVVATTITQYADSNARSAISVTDAGGEGSLSYDNSTGVVTYTGPSFSGLEVTSAKNQNNGYAGLDANGKVAAAQLPSYVDDVEEYMNGSLFPETGETGKIYVATETGKIFRWSGSAYVEISPSPGSTDAVTEGSTNLYFTTQRARDAFSASTGITLTNGAIATTITQYTDSNARSAISVTDAGGDGSLSYDNSTGVITYTGPDLSDYISVASSVVSGSVTDIDTVRTPNTITLSSFAGLGIDSEITFTGTNVTSAGLTVGVTYYLVADLGGGTFEIGTSASGSPISITDVDPITDFNYSVTVPGTFNLNDLDDVNISAPGENDVLRYNGGVWGSAAPAASGIESVSADTTPQLGGNLNVNGNSIVSISDGNISITPDGTGQTVVKNIEYNEFIHSLGTTSGTIAPDVTNGNVQTITLNGNLTLNAFTSPIAGQSVTLIVNTGGTSRTLTSTMKWAGGAKTLSVTNTTDIISVFYDGTNYWASLSTDFK